MYILNTTFKILNNQTPLYLNDLLTYKSPSYCFRFTNTVKVPQVRTNAYGVRSFRSAAAKLWVGGGGSAHASFVQTVNFCSMFCLFNVLRTSFCHKVTAHMMF